MRVTVYSRLSLRTECCSYEGMRDARELKTVLLNAGEQYTGGIVETEEGVQAFDVVKEVRKTLTPNMRFYR